MQIKWCDLEWSKMEQTVFHVQKQIYQATAANDIAMARNLQKFLVENVYEAKLLSVRTITQLNAGKKTAGVDQWIALNDEDRYAIVGQLSLDGKSSPIRRTYIPKANKAELRPLGIPTIVDRCKQFLVKLAIEPEFEARFETNSYGFRPGRKASDAISRIRTHMTFGNSPVWVFDADIRKCFDRIDHNYLLYKCGLPEPFHSQIKAWLQAGIFEEGKIFSSIEGTPQGGVISPLLANIALDGLQKYIKDYISKYFGTMVSKKVLFIRYADDFIIIAPTKEVIEYCKYLCSEFLKYVGLEINEEKSRIIQTISEIDGKLVSTPFDFLGFRFIQRYVSKHKELKLRNGIRIRYITNVVPAPSRIQRHKASITSLLKRVAKVEDLITLLNPRITGWCNYFRYSDATYNRDIPWKLDIWLNTKVRKFIRRTTKKRGKCAEFWKQDTKDWLLFANVTDERGAVREITLNKYVNFRWSISRYKPITPGFSPFQLPFLLRNPGGRELN